MNSQTTNILTVRSHAGQTSLSEGCQMPVAWSRQVGLIKNMSDVEASICPVTPLNVREQERAEREKKIESRERE